MSKIEGKPLSLPVETGKFVSSSLENFGWRPIAADRRDAGLAALTSGGAYRDRTDDPLLAKQVLSQLS